MSEQLILQQFDSKFANFKNEMLNVISTLRSATGPSEAIEPIQRGTTISSGVNTLFKSMDNARRHFDNTTKTQFDRRKKSVEREWKSIKTSFDELKDKYTTSQLNAADQARSRQQRQTMLHARDIQQDGSHSLKNTNNAIEESVTIASATNMKLDEQTDTLIRIDGTIDDTNSSLTRSQRLLETMRRRVLTNKLLQFVVIISEIIILLGILFLKYYA